MDRPHAIVVAGPNGAGKTTLVNEYLTVHPFQYVSADLIAESLQSRSLDDVRLQAGRLFFEQIDVQVATGNSFLVESTLSGRSFQRVIGHLRDARYQTTIAFVFLASAEICVARIHERVRKGGHPVPEVDIIRRFSRSCKNFWHLYRPLVDRWHLFYNGGTQFHEVAIGVPDATDVRDETLFGLFQEIVEGQQDE